MLFSLLAGLFQSCIGLNPRHVPRHVSWLQPFLNEDPPGLIAEPVFLVRSSRLQLPMLLSCLLLALFFFASCWLCSFRLLLATPFLFFYCPRAARGTLLVLSFSSFSRCCSWS